MLSEDRIWKEINRLSRFVISGEDYFAKETLLLIFLGNKKMKLQTIKSEGLAHNSYFLADQDEAVVMDPRRDCEIYLQLAKEACVKIKYILETHRNEDYVIGSMELQNLTEAEIGHSNALPFKYGEHNLVDNDTLNVGSIKIKARLHSGTHR